MAPDPLFIGGKMGHWRAIPSIHRAYNVLNPYINILYY